MVLCQELVNFGLLGLYLLFLLLSLLPLLFDPLQNLLFLGNIPHLISFFKLSLSLLFLLLVPLVPLLLALVEILPLLLHVLDVVLGDFGLLRI